jgi:2-polyprenyl-3-methyl-5-hydroxy-6-metoxy-1,4-benzoquinol methylase
MPETLPTCTLCGGGRFKAEAWWSEVRNLAPPHRVSKYLDCNLWFLNPRPTREEYAEMYEGNSGPLSQLYPAPVRFYRNEDEKRISAYREKLRFLKTAGASGRLLEIGCCTGLFLHEARQEGFCVEGVEPSDEAREIAKQHYGLLLHAGAIEDQAFTAESFDVVFANHVLEHLMDPFRVSELVLRWLRPNGLFLAEVPNEFGNIRSKVQAIIASDGQATAVITLNSPHSFLYPGHIVSPCCSCRFPRGPNSEHS